jgi:hypothetical protein
MVRSRQQMRSDADEGLVFALDLAATQQGVPLFVLRTPGRHQDQVSPLDDSPRKDKIDRILAGGPNQGLPQIGAPLQAVAAATSFQTTSPAGVSASAGTTSARTPRAPAPYYANCVQALHNFMVVLHSSVRPGPRFRLPLLDDTLPIVFAALDVTLRGMAARSVLGRLEALAY